MRLAVVGCVVAAWAAAVACEGGGDDGQHARLDSVALDDVVAEVGQDGSASDALGDAAEETPGPDADVREDLAGDGTDAACQRACEGRQCGSDGCGGSCGTCPQGQACATDGTCVDACPTDCDGRQCGDDGCGGSCGTCGADQICTALGHCATALSCTEVTKIGCCDGDVLWACDTGVVVPTACPAAGGCGWLDAEGAYGCGGDGLEGPHGAFPLDCPWACHPLCVGQECGDDGCGGSCGTCPAGTTCDFAGACCEPSCLRPDGASKACGGDGCGGSCGECALGEVCVADGSCVDACAHACAGKACGPDGCGGSCGTCDDGQTCTDAGTCVLHCTPDCTGKACGANGCGGSCGTCGLGTFCQADGSCGTTCQPQCNGHACGPDGCGGACGECDDGVLCTLAGTCGTSCTDCSYAPGCLTLGFESGNLAGWSATAQPTVISHLGATSAPEGAFMLDLDTEGEGGANDAATVQTCVPAGTQTLHFLWRLYSEEFVEFCGSEFKDYFRVTIGTSTGHAVVFERTIDDLCAAATCPQTCGAYEVPLVEADVSFDQGDVWTTPWLVANIALADAVPADGGVISVTFEAGDVGDSIYDTHILVDEIALRQGCVAGCEALDGGSKQCGDDGCGGACGACEAGHPCGADGLCGACQPQCAGKQCGPDGCGGSCGACEGSDSCQDGVCVACQPQCDAKVCGDDGCGGTCGTCAEGTGCSAGACVELGVMGSECATAADCDADMYCLDSGGMMTPTGQLVCTTECAFEGFGGSGVCPEGWTCFPNLMGSPMAYCIAGVGP